MAGVLMGKAFFVAWSTVAAHLFDYRSDAARETLGQRAVRPKHGHRHHHHGGRHRHKHGAEQLEGKSEPKRAQQSKDSRTDLITSLPGLDYDPGFKQYSGYLTVDEDHGRRIFYWYTESQNSPAEDPLVLWTNGGPGCSGMVGMGTEHGPYLFHPNGTLSPNPYSWNSVANILYIEQPSGVGFSYSDTTDDYSNVGDEQAASDNFRLIQRFLDRFPERRSNPFYIASESYGGHYMPQLTKLILDNNHNGTINFRGMLVGNPYVDPFTNTQAQFQTFYARGLLPLPYYQKWIDHCSTPKQSNSARCMNYIVNLYKFLGKGINPYALDYPICTERPTSYTAVSSPLLYGSSSSIQQTTLELHQAFADGIDSSTVSSQARKLLRYESSLRLLQSAATNTTIVTGNPPWLPSGDVFRPCAEEHLENYLNRPDVINALHAKLEDDRWKACSNKIQYDYDDAARPQIDLYKKLVGMLQHYAIHIMVYSGDDDSVCALPGTQAWIWDLGAKPKHNEEWRPWTVQDQTAGYVTQFKTGGIGSFTFVTVHGAGHEVPLYRPMEALEMFRRYLDGSWN